ncbi:MULTISPECIES: aminoglycoside 6'-N-acetyltransferase [Microvirga]|uniref:aminoglycoside 6'-N-acetyltransferase n=1 Tax=Microvirga TaxID=186650 RepID=UPI001CFF741B|nr:aminoglycoside 6'-N-acetyltransferase [Microvirga lenta]MCB5177036.1 GNAT family N-acetyltransferase [Microvirga lenta]
MRIEPCTWKHLDDWASLRHALWPDATKDMHREEAAALLEQPDRATAFLARTPEGAAAGFAEATLRRDYVNGCTSSPVAFLEGIYVDPPYRRRGVAGLLCRAVEAWARDRGCSEFASDVELHNLASQQMHASLGFEETERVVYFRKPL